MQKERYRFEPVNKKEDQEQSVILVGIMALCSSRGVTLGNGAVRGCSGNDICQCY